MLPIPLSLLVCLIGLLMWLIFSKMSFSDAWVAEAGRLTYFAGLLAYLFGNN